MHPKGPEALFVDDEMGDEATIALETAAATEQFHSKFLLGRLPTAMP